MITYLHKAIPTVGYQEYLIGKENHNVFSQIFWYAPIFPFFWLYHNMFVELFSYILWIYASTFLSFYLVLNVNPFIGTIVFLFSSFMPVLFMFLFGWKIYDYKCSQVIYRSHHTVRALKLLEPMKPITFFIMASLVIFLPLFLIFG